MTRPSWDEYFMEMAHVVAKRATCDRNTDLVIDFFNAAGISI